MGCQDGLRVVSVRGSDRGDGPRLSPLPLPGLRPAVNERSGGVLNRTSLPSDIIAFVVFCRLRYRLTLRDLSEIMALRGIEVSHAAVRALGCP